MRIPITEELLTALVEAQLNAHTQAGADFTAYDITASLRQEQPNLEIPHARVRRLVHKQMAAVVMAGEYHTAQRNFDGRWAIVYLPGEGSSPSDGTGISGIPFLDLH